MESTNTGNRGSRVGLVAALIMALTLAGCSLIHPSTTHRPAQASHAPTPQKTASSYTIKETTGGFIYQDATSGYAVTFPQRPDVEPLLHNETDQPANFTSVELSSSEFASMGQVLNKAPNLRSQVMGWVDSLNPTGQVNAGGYKLDGLDAVRAGFTTGDTPAIPSNLVGQPAETVMAADRDNFYHLVAIGGTADQRQAFFDSFKRINE